MTRRNSNVMFFSVSHAVQYTSKHGLGLEAKFYWPRSSGLGLELNEAKAEVSECEVVLQ